MEPQKKASAPDNLYANPQLIPGGKDADGRPTFYMVVNADGLNKLKQNGLLSETQRERITQELTQQNTNDLAFKHGVSADETLSFNNSGSTKGTATTQSNSDQAIQKTDDMVQQLNEVPKQLFVVEVKKDGDASKATRVFTGVFRDRVSQETIEKTHMFCSTMGTPVVIDESKNHPSLDVNRTLNLASPELPGQTMPKPVTLFLSEMLNMDNSGALIQPPLPINGSKPFGVTALPSKQNAEAFRAAVDGQRDELAQGAELPSAMREALASAADPAYNPISPEGYEAPATTGGAIADKNKGMAA